MPRLYNYEAVPASQIKEVDEIICVPGNATMLEAIAVAMAGNSYSMNVEKCFDFREAPYFADLHTLPMKWVIKRYIRS